MTIEYLIAFALGVVGGIIFKSILDNENSVSGRLIINFTNPMKDTYSLELDEPVEMLHLKKQVILSVDIEGGLPRE